MSAVHIDLADGNQVEWHTADVRQMPCTSTTALRVGWHQMCVCVCVGDSSGKVGGIQEGLKKGTVCLVFVCVLICKRQLSPDLIDGWLVVCMCVCGCILNEQL